MDKNEYSSTIKLIDEAYKNVRMGSFAIDCIITKIENKNLENLLRKQNAFYLEMTERINTLSNSLKHEAIDINPFLKGSSFASIKMKTIFNNETSHIAQMLVEGTTMGITEMIKSKNDYQSSNTEVNQIADKIISHQEKFVESLKEFL